LSLLDSAVAACLVPLAAAAVVSGLDDFVLDLCLLRDWWRRRRTPSPPAPAAAEKRIAIFLPLWREHGVIGRMLAHNLQSIRYTAYDIFAGVYPNDAETMEAVREIARRDARVHVRWSRTAVQREGRRLNWIYQAMLARKKPAACATTWCGTHDAEDVIHPDSLRWINHYAGTYDMVQVPVLPLPTRRIT
jgi:adsorption protein B